MFLLEGFKSFAWLCLLPGITCSMLEESMFGEESIMFTRWLTLMCFICLVASCSLFQEYAPKQLTEPKLIHPAKQVRTVQPFTQVYIQGPFNVRLHTDSNKKPSLKIDSDTIDLKHIQSYVKRGVLYVSVGSKKAHIGKRRLRMEEATLDINVPHLHGFTYKGEGVISARHIRSSLLDIWIMNKKQSTFSGWINLRRLTVAGNGTTKITGIHSKNLQVKLIDSPHVELKGEANLKRLDMEGGGTLRLYWVKSNNLIVRLKGTSRLKLAGTVNRLDSVVSGKAHFNGRHLRVKEAFVKTNDEAISDIAVIETQHTLARDRSDIYYYHLPSLRTDFMARNGAVLDMRSKDLKLTQPDTVYDH